MATVNAYPYSIMGLIDRTVASNNLTVALKNFDGTNFSSSAPMVHKIGSAPRSLTGALSVTVNAGTNTFNAGSAELATKEIDYFVYLGWRAASSTMFILISRIPYATTYADFSSTATNEKYGAYSGSAPASTDEVVNIGRFNATLSAGAGYTWSVPATSVIINHPIFETRLLSVTADSSTTVTGFTGALAQNTLSYRIFGRQIYYTIDIGGNSNSTTFTYKSAFPLGGYIMTGWPTNGGAFQTTTGLLEPGAGTTVNVYKDGGPNAWSNTLSKRIIVRFVDHIA